MSNHSSYGQEVRQFLDNTIQRRLAPCVVILRFFLLLTGEEKRREENLAGQFDVGFW